MKSKKGTTLGEIFAKQHAYDDYVMDLLKEYGKEQVNVLIGSSLQRIQAAIYWDGEANFCNISSKADINFWANLATWTLAEATALTINRDPSKLIEPDDGLGMIEHTSNIEQYRHVREHIKRAVQAGTLTDPVQPAVYVKWVKKRNLDFPEELAKLVPATTQADNQNTPVKPSKKPADKNYTALMRERNTLLKLFFCAAVDGCGYDHKAERSPTAKEMESAFERLGICISDDTIRKYLQEAIEVLPDDFQAPKPNSVK